MTDAPAPAPIAGWYPDPDDSGLKRYWTGSKWTEDRTPAIAAPSATPGPQVITFAKSTTVGVLFWLFLGTLGAHRHYVGKHFAALFQPLFYILGAVLMYQGATTINPGGTGPNWTLFSVGAMITGATALWVLIDVFFIGRWVAAWNTKHTPSG